MRSRPRPITVAPAPRGDFGENTLVEELLSGNPAAYQSLMRQHRGRLFSVCYQILSDAGEAEDVVQETFIKAWKNLHGFEGRSRIGTWLYRIAINLARNRVRYLARRKTVDLCVRDDLGDPIMERPDSGPGPLEVLECNRLVEQLEDLLDRIDPQYRELIVMRQIHELPYTQIVEQTGLPIGTVKSRLHRARVALNSAYEALLIRSQQTIGEAI